MGEKKTPVEKIVEALRGFDPRKPHYALLPDDEAIDEISIRTSCRMKESGLSGDGWRTHAVVELRRKGRALRTTSFRDIDAALKLLPGFIIRLFERDEGDFDWPPKDLNDWCFQPGCPEKATVTLRVKRRYSQKEGYPCPEEIERESAPTLRRFCGEHRFRGDCHIEDCDRNYESYEEKRNGR